MDDRLIGQSLKLELILTLQAFEVFDTEGYGYIDTDEIKDLLGNVDETLTVAEQEEIMSKAGRADNGRMSFARKYC